MWVSPVVAESDAKRPAVKTIAMNMVPNASDFLNSLDVLEMSFVPTTNEGLLTLARIFDFIADVPRESSLVMK